MTIYNQHGDLFTLGSDISKPLDVLPPWTFTIGLSPEIGFYLKRVEDFEALPTKIYGNAPKYAQRIIDTFNDRPNSTGVLLSGKKGTGKTMLTKEVALTLQQQYGYPVIVINQALTGEGFNSFISSIDQPTVVVFDEFEKVYDKDDQQKMLTLFDGVYSSKKLFILTVNERHRLDQHLINRPGRIFYALDYAGLEMEFIREYTIDNLNDQSRVDSVCGVAMAFGDDFSFDMLKSLVEEMNRYDETVQDALPLLNANPSGIESTFNFVLSKDKQIVATGQWSGNPLFSEDITVSTHYANALKDENISDESFVALFGVPRRDVKDNDAMRDLRRNDPEKWDLFQHWAEFEFNSTHLVGTDPVKGEYVLVDEDERTELRLQRSKVVTTHWAAY